MSQMTTQLWPQSSSPANHSVVSSAWNHVQLSQSHLPSTWSVLITHWAPPGPAGLCLCPCSGRLVCLWLLEHLCYRLHGLKQQFIILLFWSSEVQKWIPWAKIRLLTGPNCSKGSMGKFIPSSFSPSRGCPNSLA
jgi:hypothetical protein